jgi:hypothetical protein
MITKWEGKSKLKKNTGDSSQKTRGQRSEPQRSAKERPEWWKDGKRRRQKSGASRQ